MEKKPRRSFFDTFLNLVEKGGNALPHPATLFGIFALVTVILSWIAFTTGWVAVHPGTGETIVPVNLLTREGFHLIITQMVHNMVSFAPLGIVLVAMLGIGVMESSGFIGTVIRLLVISSPRKILTFVIVFSGIISNSASDIGYVLLIPLSGVIFHAVGRHPIAGMAAAFAGVSGGFSANLIIGTIDPLLSGLSEEAAHIIDPTYSVNPTCNYYFMVVSTFFIAFTGTWITEKIVVPRLGTYEGEVKPEKLERVSSSEKKGLLYSGITFVVLLGLILAAIIPAQGILRGDDGSLMNSPLITGIVAMMFLVAGLVGLAYGIGCGKFKSDSDVIAGMTDAIKTLSMYIVLVFFAAQFVAYFRWTNLGVIFAIKGAGFLESLNLGLIPLMIIFVIFAGVINLFMGSASAKWAIMAPVFIPIFMLMGYSPELSQAVYRIGDSVTNLISPMMSFFALIIAFFQKYDRKAGIGTIIATMLPYTVAFFVVWTLLLIGWVLLDLPLGPDAGLYYTLPQ
jgi:aminobenzoyl-glutamate transport protein